MLLAVGISAGLRKEDSPRQLSLIAGLLIGVALVVNPLCTNYYYLLMLPLVAALLSDRLLQFGSSAGLKAIPAAVWSFMIVDLLARLPTLGGKLRDSGFPLCNLICLLAAGAIAVREQEPVPTSQSETQELKTMAFPAQR